MFVALLLVACTSDDVGSEGQGTDDGDEPEGVTLHVEADAVINLCTLPDQTFELVTRRVDCWDPPLPCTVAQDPPWIAGTARSCEEALAPEASRWEVTVTQTGRWETRLQSGGSIACFGLGGVAQTNVSKDDLASSAELMLAAAPAGECGDP
jgi:hypothetical protein